MNYYTHYTGDGNAFSIMGFVGKVLRELGESDKAKEYMDKATAGDYNNLLKVSEEYSGFSFAGYYEGEE